MNTLNQDLKDAIDKNLSNEMGKRLQERFKELEEKEVKLSRLEQELKNVTDERDAANETLRKIRSLEAVIEENKNLLNKVETEQRNQKIFELETKLAASEKIAQDITNITMGLVRNTSFRKSVYDSEQEFGGGHFDSNNNWIAPKNTVKNYQETKTEE